MGLANSWHILHTTHANTLQCQQTTTAKQFNEADNEFFLKRILTEPNLSGYSKEI